MNSSERSSGHGVGTCPPPHEHCCTDPKDRRIRELEERLAKLEGATEALRESEQRYTALFESMSEVFSENEIVDDAANGLDIRFLKVNPAFERQTGSKAADVVGRTSRELFGRAEPIWMERYCDVVATGRAAHFEAPFGPLGRWFHVSAYPAGGRRLAVVSFDITARKRSEEALSQSEKRFRSVVENSRDVIYRVNVQTGRYEYISPSAETVVGFSTDEIMAMPEATALRMVHPDDLPTIRAAFERLPQKQREEVEYRQLTKTGEYRWVSNLMAIVFDAAGRALYRDGNIRDITERKQAEEARRSRERQFRVLIENLYSGVALTNEVGQFTVCNARFLEMFRLASDSKIHNVNSRGWSAWDVVDEQGQLLQVDDHPVRRAARTLEPVRNRLVGVRAPAGRELTWMLVSAAPILNDAGKLEYLICTYHEITDRKRAEEALRQTVADREVAREQLERSNRRLSEILGSIQDDFYALDREWRFVYASRSFTSKVGKTPEDFVGNCIWEMFPKHLGSSLQENFRAAMEHREIRRFEVAGQYTSAVYRMTVFPSADGITVLGSDVTQQKRAEATLREANDRLVEADRRKNDFLAVLSHELRNPLAPIANSLYILDHAPATGDQANRAKQTLGRQVAQLSNLVNDLLDVTRITRNKVQLQKEPLELNGVVRRVVEDNRSRFERAGVRLDLEPAPFAVHVTADGTRVSQVVSNLLQNAAKFTPQGGSTRVTVSTEDRMAVVRVRDDGVGISAENLARLFQPFVQADQTLDRSKGGLGLGLALVKGLVELHGGTVTACSEGLGRGAEFVVRFPAGSGVGDKRVETGGQSAVPRRRVLIIEDNLDAADSLRDALALGDHEVEVAYSGFEGLAKARVFKPEFVFCDIGLPGMSGYEVAQAFRSDADLHRIYVVALSGYALPEDVQRAIEAGFDRHLAKPPSLRQLEELLSEQAISRAALRPKGA